MARTSRRRSATSACVGVPSKSKYTTRSSANARSGASSSVGGPSATAGGGSDWRPRHRAAVIGGFSHPPGAPHEPDADARDEAANAPQERVIVDIPRERRRDLTLLQPLVDIDGRREVLAVAHGDARTAQTAHIGANGVVGDAVFAQKVLECALVDARVGALDIDEERDDGAARRLAVLEHRAVAEDMHL